jgi:hypothetical protein
VEHDFREVRERENVGVRAGVREALPHREEHGIPERAAREEHGVRRATHPPCDIGRPREERVGHDADRGTDAGDELFERGLERFGRAEEGDELVDLEVGEGVCAGGQAVLGGRERERAEADGRGRRREGEGGQEARGGNESDLNPWAESTEEAS